MKTQLLSLALALLIHLGWLFLYHPAAPMLQAAAPLQVLLQPLPPPAARAMTTPPASDKPSRRSPAARILSASPRIHPASAVAEKKMPPAESIATPVLNTSVKGLLNEPDTHFTARKPLPNMSTAEEPRRSPLAKSLDKAVRPDCKTAHAHLGLLAIVPLALDAATDSGCQW